MKKKNRNLVEGNIKKQLMQLTWPMLFGLMGIVIFNLVDTYFVGKLGVKQLAAMSFTFPVIMILNSFSQSIGIGTSSLISRNIIATHRDEVKKMASSSILLGVIVVMIFVIIGLLTIRPIFSLIGAKGDILEFVVDYMQIWYFGVPFVVIPMIGNNIVRATGDTFFPGMLMVLSGVVNTILDPLFIFGIGPFPEMGIKGAALATVIGRSVGLVFILYVLIKREKLLTFRLGSFSEIFTNWKKVLYIAGPTALGMLITPVSIGFITKIIAGFGKEAVAAFGVASRIEMLALMVIAAFGTVLIIFIGQNLSKNKFQRIFKTINYAKIFSLSWGTFVFVVLLIFGRQIASVFTKDLAVIEITLKYFYIIGASYGFQGLVMLSSSSYNGINKPHPSAFFSVVRMIVLYVPLAWIGARYFDLAGVFGAGLIANVIVGVVSFWYLNRTINKISVSHS